MAVTRTSTGALFSSAAAGTVTFGAGAAAGNLGILIVETANQAITTPTGWTLQKGGAGTGTGVAAAAAATMLSIYTKDSISAGDVSGGIAISDSGDHQNACLVTCSGHDTTGRGLGASVGGSGLNIITPASTSAATNGVGSAGSILVGDLVLAIIVTDRDSATVSTNTSPVWNNIAGSNSFPENLSSATGAGGGIIVNELVPSGSSTGAVSFSCSITSSIMITCALQIFAPATTITGTLAKTLGAVTSSSNGSFTSRIATLATTLSATTLSANATLKINGTLSNTLGTLTLSSASKLAIKSSTTKTLDAVTLSSAAKLKINGTLAKTLGTLTLSSIGSHSGITGTVTASLAPATLSSAGKLLISGSLNKNLGTLLGAEVGHLLLSGTLAKTLASATVTSSGKLAIKATLNQTLATLVGTETGQLHIAGSLNFTLASVLLTANGHLPLNPIVGNCSQILGSLLLSANSYRTPISLRRRGSLGEPINSYKAHKYIRNGNGYWTK